MTAHSPNKDLYEVLAAATIHSPTRYSFLGELRDLSRLKAIPEPGAKIDLSPADFAPSDGQSSNPAILLSLLESELYTRLYRRPSPASSTSADVQEARDFVNALSAANNGIGTWDPGWKIMSFEEDGSVTVSKDRIAFCVEPAGLQTFEESPSPGAYCRVRIGKEMRQLFTGYYMALGNGDEQDRRDKIGPLVRFYWNLTAETAVEYVKQITGRLNAERVPFRTKVISNPALYVNADAGVLYIEKEYFLRARDIVVEVYRKLANRLKPEVPMFTKQLARGLALAEDPRNGLSFGQSRCKIAAQGLWACYTAGITDPQSRLSTLAEAFQQEALHPGFLYLEPESSDIYEMPEIDCIQHISGALSARQNQADGNLLATHLAKEIPN